LCQSLASIRKIGWVLLFALRLPDKRPGAWGQGITAEKMKKCRWLKPSKIAEVEFTEWTPNDRLRGAVFVGLRHDKSATKVVKES
jgi:bifunctional non-homologous end joining protein LigD